jgi:large subunit ribosomal protein L23
VQLSAKGWRREMHPYDILKRPVITEKSNFQSDLLGQFTFEVDRRANKQQIKNAVETVFDVTVERVRVINMPAKRVRRHGRREVVRRVGWKKAIVKLASGDRIEFFEGV